MQAEVVYICRLMPECAQVLPKMAENGQGTIIFTGATAALRGGKNFALLSVPKFALRGLSQNIAREFQPQVGVITCVIVSIS